ncbi:PKHD-type hydroxylase [Tepidimonas alkaliphilus]|uniref:PKHD-type hydroxylase n=1 Tax=Tepidimonas alkaliphilus TaxID=2588942 RepID=A0A554W9Y6_9BURK|nr:Fe2+-dependent dioxygenase [Tepidimonas alkaliphilus]TSE20392.1 PKHD-type hydroxylase [Tepidimonas alkaliphilus]
MLLHLQGLLTADERAHIRAVLDAADAPWRDGRLSAGSQAALVKHNEQLAHDSPQAAELRAMVLTALQREPLFFSAALPRKIFNPLFNRYRPQAPAYGRHIDGAVLHSQADGQWVRSDLSCTVFLSDPDEYDGGELTIHDTYGVQRVKLPAGDAVLYPGTSLHEVTPVTRGTRLASFLWIESMVRHDEQRRLLFELDMNLLQLRQQLGETAQTTALTGVYHNLLRMWAST